MAKVRRWKETLVLACATLLLSVTRAWPRGPRNVGSSAYPVYSSLITGMDGKAALGVELMARKPYVRMVRASLVPVSLPLAAGAYVAVASSPLAAGAPLAAASGSACSTGPVCNPGTAPCCSVTAATCCDLDCGPSCWIVHCFNYMGSPWSCTTCGYGTCAASCQP